jgi:bidirectional [NiFe] hydrogenase diaphorase subunit
MEEMTIHIDGKPYAAEKGMTVLQVARDNGIAIPTLCFHPALKPSGSCKLCAVEVVGRSRRSLTMLSCVMRIREGLEVRTDGEAVKQARIKAFGNLLRMAPQSRRIRDLADRYGVELPPQPDGCIRCRLCIRVCKEIVGAEALKMEKRDGRQLVVPIEGHCVGCGTCANLCPTEAIRIEDQETVRKILIREEVVGTHPLVRCEGCGKRFATQKFLALTAERLTPHPESREQHHHHYCPTCAKVFSGRIASFKDRKQRMPGHQ